MASGVVLDPLGALRQEVEQVSQDETLPADERIGKLRLLIEDMTDLLGRTQTYVADLELVREARDPVYREHVMEMRENADIRELLIERGHATGAELDSLGYLSHDDIAKLQEEHLLEAWIAESFVGDAEHAFDELKHPRGAHGKFSDVFGRPVTPKGRHGRSVPLPRGGGAGAGKTAERAVASPPHPHVPGSVSEKPRSASDVQSEVERARDLDSGVWEMDEAARAVLGDSAGTHELHSVPVRAAGGRRVYTPERQALHDRIVDMLLRERRPVDMGDGTMEMHPHSEGEPLKPVGSQPVALLMAGGTASGKSTALAQPEAREILPEGAAHIDPDEIKAMLPEYSQLLAQGSRYAASAVHEESSQIAGRVRAEAVKRGLNVVMDGTGDSDPGKTAAKIKQMRDAGYEVRMMYVNAPTQVAITQAAQRAGRTGRWVPEAEIRKQHRNVSARFASDVAPLVQEGTVSHLRMYHNEGGSPTLMAEARGGDMQVYHPDLFEKFVEKQHEAA